MELFLFCDYLKDECNSKKGLFLLELKLNATHWISTGLSIVLCHMFIMRKIGCNLTSGILNQL